MFGIDINSEKTTVILVGIVLLLLFIFWKKEQQNKKSENFEETSNEKKPNKELVPLTFVQEMEVKKLLKIIHNALEENKIDYMVCGGTLLGAIRHKNIIPWDDDADINIFDKDTDKFEKIDWGKYGCRLDKHWIGYKITFKDGKKAIENGVEQVWNFPFVDVFIFSNTNGTYTHSTKKCREWWPKDIIYEDELFPLKKYQFDDMMLCGPNKVYQYLDRYFGPGWEITAETKHKKIKFEIRNYSKAKKSVNYLWIIGNSDKYKNKLIDEFNKDYVLIFVNKDNLKTYLPDTKLKLENSEDASKVKSELFAKHGGKFVILA
jgi:hypothetical protein